MNSSTRPTTITGLPGLLTLLGIAALPASACFADAIPGTASLSGTVTAERPFEAAMVYARNLDESMLYTVYTNKGEYRAINLMPGGYEVWAEKGELRSEHQWLRIHGEADIELDHVLKPGPAFPLTMKSRAREGVQQVSYDELYPPGPGRDLAKDKCMACHGQGFLNTHHLPTAGWDAMIGLMLNPDAVTRNWGQRGAMITGGGSVGSITAEERQTLAEYLGEHFGPQSPNRILRLDTEYPLDEEVLSKAMFIEYLAPLTPGTDLSVRARNEPGRHMMIEPHIDNTGNIWATNGFVGVSRIDPRTAEWSHYPFPEPNTMGHGMTIDSKGHVFWAEFVGKHVGRLDPETGKMDRFPIDPTGSVRDVQGHTPHLDSKENLWFTVINGNRIGRWDRETEQMKLWEIPTPNSFPYGIDVDQNDNVWFAELWGCNAGRFDPATEQFTEYAALGQPCAMNRLAVDSKGVVWYSLVRTGVLGRLDPETGEQEEWDIASFRPDKNLVASFPYGIIADHNDKIWFGDQGLGGALIMFDPETEKFAYYPHPRQTDNPNIDRTREGAIIYTTRSNRQAAIGIFYPDVSKMTGYGVYR